MLSIYVCLPLVKMKHPAAYLCIVISLLTKHAISYIVISLPEPFPWMYAAVAPFLAAILARFSGADKEIYPNHEISLRDLSIVSPRSFIPVSNAIFVTIAVFSLATGCALTYLTVDGSPQESDSLVLPLLVLFIASLFDRRLKSSTLVRMSFLLILLGFLVIPLSGSQYVSVQALHQTSPWLFSAGSTCFTVVLYLLLSQAARRNSLASIPIIGFGLASARLGFETGALLGLAFNSSPEFAIVASIGAAFAFSCYGTFQIGKIDFEALIEAIEPVKTPLQQPSGCSMQELENKYKSIIEAFSLTPRESEVFILLAQGRNASVIQERLVISKNTVKTHVKNIYAKLGIHSQQELIDMIQSA